MLAGGRLGCHGNCRVRSPGCCSARVGTHYATSHVSVSICLHLFSSVAFTPALCPLCGSPLFSLYPVVFPLLGRKGGEKCSEDGGMDG